MSKHKPFRFVLPFNEDWPFGSLDDQAENAGYLPGADKIVVPRRVIRIAYDYPFDKEYVITLRSGSSRGFTKQVLVRKIVRSYKTLYNRLDKQGKVWGHSYDDLGLEGIRESAKRNLFLLDVGS
jgi:hypothetical protein